MGQKDGKKSTDVADSRSKLGGSRIIVNVNPDV